MGAIDGIYFLTEAASWSITLICTTFHLKQILVQPCATACPNTLSEGLSEDLVRGACTAALSERQLHQKRSPPLVPRLEVACPTLVRALNGHLPILNHAVSHSSSLVRPVCTELCPVACTGGCPKSVWTSLGQAIPLRRWLVRPFVRFLLYCRGTLRGLFGFFSD